MPQDWLEASTVSRRKRSVGSKKLAGRYRSIRSCLLSIFRRTTLPLTLTDNEGERELPGPASRHPMAHRSLLAKAAAGVVNNYISAECRNEPITRLTNCLNRLFMETVVRFA